MWHDHIHQAISELYQNITVVSPVLDYQWVNSDDGPNMVYWNEEKLGSLNLQEIQTLCEEIATRKIVPKTISKAQALQALDNVGLYESVVDTVSQFPVKSVKIWFDNANQWERDHPYIHMFGPQFNLTDDEIDDLFIAAAKL